MIVSVTSLLKYTTIIPKISVPNAIRPCIFDTETVSIVIFLENSGFLALRRKGKKKRRKVGINAKTI